MSLRVLIPLTLLGIGLMGCPPKEDDTAPEGDTDTDTDTDTDSDTDADTDTNPDWPASFAGDLTYVYSYGGETICDAAIDLVGTKYTGACAGCDFAFAMDPTVTEDNGTADCYLHPYLSYIDSGVYTNMMMAHMDSYAGYYGSYNNAMLTGFSVDYSAYGYGYYPGPYFFMLSYDGSANGAFTRTGDDVEWDWSYTGYDATYEYNYLDDCGAYLYYDDFTTLVDTAGSTGEVDCDGQLLDVWGVDLAVGETVEISIDTANDATAFDPLGWLNDPDGCAVSYNDDSFDCTYPPVAYQCPAMDHEVTVAGTHQIVIASYNSCNGSVSGYELKVLVDGAPAVLTQIADDVDRYDVSGAEYSYEIQGMGAITP